MPVARRSFLVASTGLLAAVGVVGCRRLEDALAEYALGPQDGPLRPPTGVDIDDFAHVLNRLTFGARPGDRGGVESSGVDAFLASQLQPDAINDRRCEWMLTSIEPLAESRAEAYDRSPEELLQALACSRILRAVHSKRQLLEVMVEVWSDHLNIVWSKGECRWVRLADEIEVLRPHALGRFRDLIRASSTSPAMLLYLDGHDNKVVHPDDRPNENYARELLELHTLGVDGGYSQRDVLEAARCLSGWTYGHRFWQGRISEVAFDPKRHDAGEKEVLGIRIPAGGGAEDLERLLDVVCLHPSTSRHVARRLCRTFIADPPPEDAVATVSAAFLASGGDLKVTLRALFAADTFRAHRGNLLKRPFRFLASALRGTAASTDGGPALLDVLRRMGQAPSEYPTPDGYPLEPEPWVGSLFWRWNLALALGGGGVRGTRIDEAALAAAAGGESAMIAHLLGRRPDPAELELIQSSGAAIAMALASPAFQWH